MAEQPWRDEDTLREAYNKGGSLTAAADILDCSSGTVSKWLDKFGIEKNPVGAQIQHPELHDEGWLRQEYVGNKRSTRNIAQELGVYKSAVLDGLERCGIDRRDTSESTRLGMETSHAGFHTSKTGYEYSTTRTDDRAWKIGIHQLVAIADGADPHKVLDGNHHVHHENNIQWDNRPENLTVATNSEHMKEHAKEDRWGKS